VRVALASCRDLPGWEVDDAPLIAALEARRVAVDRPAWTDASYAWSAADAVLLRTTWDYQEALPAFLRWAHAVSAVTRLFNPIEIIRWNANKRYLLELGARGVRLAPTVLLPGGAPRDVAAEVGRRGWSRGFLKPAVGATARETLRFDADAAGLGLADAHASRLAHEDLLLQPYLSSVETLGERSAIAFEGVVSHWVRKLPVPGDYRVQDDFGASDMPLEPSAAERELVAAALAALGETLLYARVDWLFDDAGWPCLNELELIEPSLFLRHAPAAAGVLADALIARIAQGEP
jgi:hypothetical protein